MRQGSIRNAVPLLVAAMMLAGCSNDMSDLESFIAETNQRPGGRIEPLPEISVHVHGRQAGSALAVRAGTPPEFSRPGGGRPQA